MKLTFLGATGTVTGSKYLLEDENKKFLIDCGLFQGLKELRLRNWDKLPFDPSAIDAVLLTHAHLDHSGCLPLLVREGFKGKIYATPATIELCEILLMDSANIQEEDAERANRYGYSKHKPALPLYTRRDAERTMEYFKPVEFGKKYALTDILNFEYSRAGHILGAASIKIDDGATSVVFSGDVGRPNDPIIHPPAQIQEADILLLESTYGDRLHEKDDPSEILAKTINETAARGGIIMIPSFAVGRVQTVLYLLDRLKRERKISDLPVFLDSPMAIDATDLWIKYHHEHKMSEKQCREICSVARYLRSPEESKTLDNLTMPSVIIAGSGMATGGRILHHMKRYIGDPRNTLLFTGYQAAGTRGARILSHEEEVKIHGQLFPVRAQVSVINSMSAHADYAELLQWLSHFRKLPRKIYLTHGEPEAAAALKTKIEERFACAVEIPEYKQSVEL